MAPLLGQHFLKNKAVIQKSITALELKKGDTIVEIGPGHGELTAPLIAACEAMGCKIVAIEKDIELAEKLSAEYAAKAPLLEIMRGDALKILPSAIHTIRPPYKLIGNIPYYITGKLLRTIGELEKKPARTVLMVQREVAERMCAVPPKMNRLAASIQFWADPKILSVVPREDFSPRPEVDSAIVLLATKAAAPEIPPDRYYAAVRALFAQPRKTVLNNLFEAKRSSLSKTEAAAVLEANGVEEKLRPQDLSREDVVAIAKSAF